MTTPTTSPTAPTTAPAGEPAPAPAPQRDLTAIVTALAVAVVLMILGATGYLVYRHPALAAPISACGAVATALVGVAGLLLRRR